MDDPSNHIGFIRSHKEKKTVRKYLTGSVVFLFFAYLAEG